MDEEREVETNPYHGLGYTVEGVPIPADAEPTVSKLIYNRLLLAPPPEGHDAYYRLRPSTDEERAKLVEEIALLEDKLRAKGLPTEGIEVLHTYPQYVRAHQREDGTKRAVVYLTLEENKLLQNFKFEVENGKKHQYTLSDLLRAALVMAGSDQAKWRDYLAEIETSRDRKSERATETNRARKAIRKKR